MFLPFLNWKNSNIFSLCRYGYSCGEDSAILLELYLYCYQTSHPAKTHFREVFLGMMGCLRYSYGSWGERAFRLLNAHTGAVWKPGYFHSMFICGRIHSPGLKFWQVERKTHSPAKWLDARIIGPCGWECSGRAWRISRRFGECRVGSSNLYNAF